MNLYVITASIVKRAPRRVLGSANHAAKKTDRILASRTGSRSFLTFASQNSSMQMPSTISALACSGLAIISSEEQTISSSRTSLGRNAKPSRRSFATYPPQLNAFPQYSVFGETCVLGLRVMLPAFKVLKNNTLVLDNNKRGRMVLEWTARTADGRIDRDGAIRFALSAEECGLLLDQLKKDQKVDFLRQAYNPDNMGHSYASATPETPDKVMYISPGEGGMTSFKVDFEKDGIGGQEQVLKNGPVMGPLEVVVQTGELQVMLSIIESTLPQLTGWTTSMDIAMQRAINTSLNLNGSGGGGGGFYDDNQY